jgi:hypothetical protein
MDAIKSKNTRIGEPVELSLLTKDKPDDNNENEHSEYPEDVSSGKLLLYHIACS